MHLHVSECSCVLLIMCSIFEAVMCHSLLLLLVKFVFEVSITVVRIGYQMI